MARLALLLVAIIAAATNAFVVPPSAASTRCDLLCDGRWSPRSPPLPPPEMETALFAGSIPSSAPVRPASSAPSVTSLGVDIKVQVGEGEPIESALRRFKREVNKSGHLMELRHKRYFENSQDRKKRKIVQARFRIRMERMNARRMKQQRT
ncbi:hypothetical protein ACHAW5_000339 [Stephanodiscus triporus]|uniref:30S ribosomal protein S21 n=1 Tax=Stephanodiscus triporus TaxID=2934178 RepID=A0ABD3NL15_9STRA